MKLSRFVNGFVAVALMAFLVSDALGQDQGRRPGGGGRGGAPGGFQGRGGGPGGPGGFGGGDMSMALIRVEEVQKELEVTPQQKEAFEKLAERAREARPDFSGFREMSEADRTAAFEKMRKQAEEIKAQLEEEVLLPEQVERLGEIVLQVRGVQALEDSEVAAKLNITPDQKKKLAEVRESQMEKMRERMREMFQAGGGPGGFDREAFGKLREDMEKEVLAVLDSGQQKTFEEMKGEKFEMPENFGRGGFGGGPPGGGRGGRGGPDGGRGGRGGRPPAQ